jgi:asparagine synthase (glutamine-hydrolysing)
MSILFGIWQRYGRPVNDEDLSILAHATDRYAPDGTFVTAHGEIGMGFQPYYTHERSRRESQPVVDAAGNMLVFDGRLDNHCELCKILETNEGILSDSQIVLAAYLHWGEECFSKLIGDWALAVWSRSKQSLYLARDHAGTRTLYFDPRKDMLLWSTYLETFFTSGNNAGTCEQYAARYLCGQKIGALTPFQNIRAVPPAHYLRITPESQITRAHWSWIAQKRLRFNSDSEFEEQFRALFRQSIERRIGPESHILAQLSGGMDSTAIVCMSDAIRREKSSHASLVDTLSFYDDKEPNWDERPYFTVTETKRGKAGIHIDLSPMGRTFDSPNVSFGSHLIPGFDSSTLERERLLLEHAGNGQYRVIVSGIGGDEVLGGVPTPFPELADALVSGDVRRFFRQGFAWALVDRTSLLLTLLDTIKFTVGLYRLPPLDKKTIPPWVTPALRDVCEEVNRNDRCQKGSWGSFPSAISNGRAWWSILETQPHLRPGSMVRYEYRFPFLDRDLVEFLFQLPREQLVRPGRRRSLMRRALRDLIPAEILERRRKAFLVRSPLRSLQSARARIEALFERSCAADAGYLDPVSLRACMRTAIENNDPRWSTSLIRAIEFELWLRVDRRLDSCAGPTQKSVRSTLRTKELHVGQVAG